MRCAYRRRRTGGRRSRTVPLTALLAVALLAGAGCAGPADGGPPPATTSTTAGGGASGSATSTEAAGTTAPPTSAATASAPPAPSPAPPAGTPGATRDVATGLRTPWDAAFLPDGAALVTLRGTSRVVRVAADGTVTPVPATGPGGAVPGAQVRGEGGLLGIALSPSFARDGLVYLYTTTATDNRVVRARYAGARLGPPTAVLTGIPAATNHDGGRIRFGPDGMLYVGTGDAGLRERAQDLGYLGGKILRLTPDGAPAPGNPFPASRVWTLGHRNVQGLGWDRAGRMYASEFGQDRLDELNRIEPGRNYGWPQVEGTEGPQDRRFTAPLLTWTTREASPSGIAVASDAIYVAALRGQRLWRVPLDPAGRVGRPTAYLVGALGRLRTAVPAPDRSLWLLTDNEFRGVPRPGDDRIVRLSVG